VLQPPFINRKAKLARRGNPLFDALAARAGFRLLRLPGLLVYRGAKGRLAAVLAAAALRALGYPVKLVGHSVFRDLCPDSEATVDGAVLVEGYATVVPGEVLESLKTLLEGEGVEFHVGVRVDAVKPRGGGRGVVVESGLGVREYDAAIVAAGADTNRLARMAGLRPPRVGYYKGVMAFARLDCRAVAAELLARTRSRETKGGGVIPWPDGRVLLGPTFEETRNPWDTSYTVDELEEAAESYVGVLGFKPEVRGGLAGTRVKNLERDDFYTASARGVVFLGAIDSPGFTASPVLAKWALEQVLQGV
jgi:glycerol-3-phosphate dehydrogenase